MNLTIIELYVFWRSVSELLESCDEDKTLFVKQDNGKWYEIVDMGYRQGESDGEFYFRLGMSGFPEYNVLYEIVKSIDFGKRSFVTEWGSVFTFTVKTDKVLKKPKASQSKKARVKK